MFRFSHHTFDPDTGELDGPRGSLRLQPKPARLLGMLLEAGGELVERERIRAVLWPDTNVDFDAGLNTCIRQIRTALRESGADTDYIETLPKRGYRIIVSSERPDPLAGAALVGAAPTPAAVGGHPGATALLPYFVIFVVLAVGTAVVLWEQTFAGAAAPARLAVVPFVDPASDANADFNRDLTEAFIAALVNAAPDDIVVVGPSTTARYFAGGASLPDVASAVDADFVLHGGHRSSADIFFVEVVLPDGEHLFAQRMALDLGAPATAPADVVAAMAAAIVEAARR